MQCPLHSVPFELTTEPSVTTRLHKKAPNSGMPILELAMPTPLRLHFDYLPPASSDEQAIKALQPGCRVLAPFGRRKLVGVLLRIKSQSELPAGQLKPAEAILDTEPPLPDTLFQLGCWAATYYQHPLGDALSQTLPVLLRKGEALPALTETHWRLTTEGKGLPEGALQRAKQQARLLALLQQHPSLNRQALIAAGISTATTRALQDKGLIESFSSDIDFIPARQPEAELTLNSEQQQAVAAIINQQGFHCALLEGVTGSGKTEVYLQLIAHYLQQGKQALVMIPEIGLTPQTLARFQRRFNCPIVVLHSGMTDKERLQGWQQARLGKAGIVIGTRSAVFTPLANPGLIIIDEEHDGSYKQQDGFRYSARDVAIKRAALENIPILLGSATPSLETLHNAQQGRYQRLPLQQRATGAPPPQFELLDIRHAPLQEGFSHSLLSNIGKELERGNQVLVFINRRGFSPILMCHDCGYVAQCQHCDARMTVHYAQRLLRCHHCEHQQPLPGQCPDCNSWQLDFQGVGTERSEHLLKSHFPSTPVIRIDRDTTSQKQAMSALLQKVQAGEPSILVGTQMLAKGHHFADVTLVAILDADGGLFSADFRAPEKMGQLLIQVAGRAGRESKPGRVMIQTHQPDHPLLNQLLQQGYQPFARQLLAERRLQQLPPYAHLALFRAEAKSIDAPEHFLRELRQTIPGDSEVNAIGPLPAPMTRRAGHYRIHLLLQANKRSRLHQLVDQLCAFADALPLSKKVRWHVDIDPLEAF